MDTLTELQVGNVIFNNYGQVKSQARDQHIAGGLIISEWFNFRSQQLYFSSATPCGANE
jgi:hypothetical protein